MTSATGSPQKSAERPRARRPSEGSRSGRGSDSPGTGSDVEVSVLLEASLIVVEQAHRLGWLHPVGLDGLIDLRLHLALQFRLVVLHRGESLNDRRALDDFFNVVTGRFVGIEED